MQADGEGVVVALDLEFQWLHEAKDGQALALFGRGDCFILEFRGTKLLLLQGQTRQEILRANRPEKIATIEEAAAFDLPGSDVDSGRSIRFGEVEVAEGIKEVGTRPGGRRLYRRRMAGA